MEPDRFYRGSSLLIVAGKGGVGKTTVSAALALGAARRGFDVSLLGLADPREIPRLFGSPTELATEPTVLAETSAGGRVRGRSLVPDEILLEYLVSHGFGRIARRLGSAGTLDVVASAVPGIREVLVLGKIKQLERRAESELFVLDAPASGHAIRFLTSASGLADASRDGPLRAQADAARELLTDPERTAVVLVTLPEETPVNETVETAFRIEDEIGTRLGPVVVNDALARLDGLDADPTDAAQASGVALAPADADAIGRVARFRLERQSLEAAQIERLAAELPLPRIVLSHQLASELGPETLGRLADELDTGIEGLA